jgi:hypothetical protein
LSIDPYRKRAPSDEQRPYSRLVEMDRAAVKSRLGRIVALIATLGALAMLAMAGGASFGGL